jgi:hypothetical protein
MTAVQPAAPEDRHPRPLIYVDLDYAETLAQIGCGARKIEDIIGASMRTMRLRDPLIMERLAATRLKDLAPVKRTPWRLARYGDVETAILLDSLMASLEQHADREQL